MGEYQRGRRWMDTVETIELFQSQLFFVSRVHRRETLRPRKNRGRRLTETSGWIRHSLSMRVNGVQSPDLPGVRWSPVRPRTPTYRSTVEELSTRLVKTLGKKLKLTGGRGGRRMRGKRCDLEPNEC